MHPQRAAEGANPVGDAAHPHPGLLRRAADPVVGDLDGEPGACASEPDHELAGPGVLDGVGEGLSDHEVRRAGNRAGEVSADVEFQPHRQRHPVGQVLHRGGEPALDQQGRHHGVHQFAQAGGGVVDPAPQLRRGPGKCGQRAGQVGQPLRLKRQQDQGGLQPVVQVPGDPAPFTVFRLHDAAKGMPEHLLAGQQFHRQPLAVHRDGHRPGRGAHQSRIVNERLVVVDRPDPPAAQVYADRAPARPRPGQAELPAGLVKVDLPVRRPEGDPQRRVTKAQRERVLQ